MQQKLLTLLVIAITVVCLNKTQAQSNYTFAAGLRLSPPAPTLNNAITIKYFANEFAAFEGIVSFGSGFGVGVLFEKHQPINATAGFQWLYGFGGYFGARDKKVYVGPTGIVGLDYKFEKIPLNLSLDWKPELDILPAVNFVPDGFALSARFTLK